MEDKGRVTIENADGSNGRMEAFRSHYKWRVGLALRDWRYVVRIANIESSKLKADISAGADLVTLMTDALEHIYSLRGVRPVFYMNKTIRSMLRKQIVTKAKYMIAPSDVAGKQVMLFDEVPVRRVDALLNTEATIS